MMRMSLAAAWLGLLVSAALGDERILSYRADIVVQTDAWLTVTETIRVRAEGQQIKRGIYREFPVRYRGRNRTSVLVPFDVVAVERDGKPEPHHTKSEGNAVKLYMGEESVFLPSGEYTYTIAYRTTRQIGFFGDHDELYWNVTGNKWAFPIDEVSATVTLPPGIAREQIKAEAYTGPEGSKGKDYEAVIEAVGRVSFRATRPLGVGEGLTIVASFPKGFVQPPSRAESFRAFFAGNAMVVVGVAGMATLLVYFVAVWFLFGRDPPGGIVIPLFEAPKGFCPAAVRYVSRMAFDKTCFAAALIDMGVKGYLTVEQEGRQFALRRTPGGKTADLSAGEVAVAGRLLGSAERIELKNSNHAKFTGALGDLKKKLAAAHVGTHFYANGFWMGLGIAISVATLVAIAVLGALIEKRPEVAFLCVWLTGWSFGVYFLLRQTVAAWQSAKGCAGVAGALFTTFFAVPFCGAELVVLGVLSWMTSLWLVPILAVMGTLNAVFLRLLKRPTPAGRKIMDQIEGYRMYLGTAEQDLLEAAHPPEKTPEVFERNLPYALALGVENRWAEKFSDVLQRAAQEQSYSPSWYHGAAWSAAAATGFASSLGQSFTSALSSASTAPGSRSGGGGGGSSGGGGGGGGGGGW